jgi:hypothetical protein
MRKNRIKAPNKYIIAYYIKINKGAKVFQLSKITWLNILSIIN